MAPMLYVTLMLQLLAFVARTMLNRENLCYRIVAIHCILLLLLLLSRRSGAREKWAKGRRFWVRAIFRQRQRFDCYHTLVQELRLGDREWHFKFIRMSPERFEHLLRLIAPHISKKKTKLRNPIGPAERLYLTLRYLASGDSQQSQSFHFRIGKATVSKIIKETCTAIWRCLNRKYLQPPQSSNRWKRMADDFEE